MDFIIELDKIIFKFIHSLSGHSGIIDWLSIFFAEDSRIFMGGLFFLGLVLIYRKYPDKPLYYILVATMIFLLPVMTSAVLREAIMRARPFVTLDITPLIEQSIRYSLPSNHTAASFAIAGMYLAFLKKHFKPVLILAFLVAIARVHTGVHYPLDVTVGAIIGILPGLGLYYQEVTTPDHNEKHSNKHSNNKKLNNKKSNNSKKTLP
ncbi:phosphatase PAP2 family protein [Natranaerofaba carboxydovora]|uniref:phosphatase PAP2 family protein n=1 Tax=Natranaerofaba carboxydovora TaxID=2742683 RepID=UPI001F12FC5F|nr:phosphatase PAP2 family protein [Natranaerofaba carboxydovora]UMZ75014.1 Undecaprenyl-diphosphatase BcrC [Natranaerofaba carboxydovora]